MNYMNKLHEKKFHHNISFNLYLGLKAASIREKVPAVFGKNQGLQTLELIAQRTRGETLTALECSTLEDYSPDELAAFSFAPINSAQVERAFSLYKNIFRDRRRSFSFDNLKMFFIVHCFYSLTSSDESFVV